MKRIIHTIFSLGLINASAFAAPSNPDYRIEPHWNALPKSAAESQSIKRGYSLFMNTVQLKGDLNGLLCVNCHIASGRLAYSAPMWAFPQSYPAYRKKNNKINTDEDRVEECFLYSLNSDSKVHDQDVEDLIAYAEWLAKDVPDVKPIPGRGDKRLPPPKLKPSYARGKDIYKQKCAVCHGKEGQGKTIEGHFVFPPLWGEKSFNWGAGMHKVDVAAGFIKMNMPLAPAKGLTDQEAWDVAFYVNSHERPQDPRYTGNVEETKKLYHDHDCEYGDKSPATGEILGMNAFKYILEPEFFVHTRGACKPSKLTIRELPSKVAENKKLEDEKKESPEV